ncbi:MAG: hypothetical protein M0P31_06090 [Solirubrobacteraceae bacterium]|nr:hypothetical protein [Solirubrobacteraceae bacterium]
MLGAIPPPPTWEAMPDVPEMLFLGFSTVFLVAFVAYGIHRWRTKGEVLALLFAAGGAVCSLYEPIVGTMGHMYIPKQDAMVAWTFIDRSMPVFVPVAYVSAIGGSAYIAYRVAKDGRHPRRLFILFAIEFAAIISFETPAVLMDVYHYYGDQPLNLWGMPLWWGFVNPISGMFVGVAIYALEKRSPRDAKRFAFPLMCVGPGFSNGLIAAPMWLVLGDDSLGWAWQYDAAAISLGLALMCIRLLTVLGGLLDDDAPPSTAAV